MASRQEHGGYCRRNLDLNLEPELDLNLGPGAEPEPGPGARAGLKPKNLVGAGMANLPKAVRLRT